MDAIPFITHELDGIGGRIKASPQYFIVEEIPLYEPSGQGDHIYVRLQREGLNTQDMVRDIAPMFSLRERDIGVAGQKDKNAVAVQTFSLNLREADEAAVARRIEERLPVKALSVKRHTNKLRTGHLLGNSFTIVLTGVDAATIDQAKVVASKLQQRGAANFFGVQRFGARGNNAERGKECLTGGGPRKKWLRRFLLSAFQSQLFNEWLSNRINQDRFDCLILGDVAKKTETGGLFVVEDIEAETKRFESGEITFTGPIFGAKTKEAQEEEARIENELLERHEVTIDMLKKAGLDGGRRPAKINLPFIGITPHEEGLTFKFSLPKGSYATTIMREFTKTETEIEGKDEEE